MPCERGAEHFRPGKSRLDRGLSLAGIAAGILVGPATCWAVLATPHCPGTGEAGNTVFRSTFGLGAVSAGSLGDEHWYNVSVASSGPGIEFRDLHFRFQTVNGSIVPPGSNWTFHGSSWPDRWSIPYSWSTAGLEPGAWSTDSTIAVAAGSVFGAYSASGDLADDVLVAVLVGTLSNGCTAVGETTVGVA